MWTRQARTSRLVLFNTSHKHTKITRPPRRVPHVTRARSPFLPVRRRRVRSSLLRLWLWVLLCAWLMLRWSVLPAGLRLSCTPSCSRRWLSTTRPVCADSSPRWGDTLLLPKTAFPLYNDPSKDPALRNKTTEDLYRWQVGISWDKPPSPPLMLVSFSGSMRKALSLSFMTARPTRMETCIWVSF